MVRSWLVVADMLDLWFSSFSLTYPKKEVLFYVVILLLQERP